MSDFESEFKALLQSELGADAWKASRIATQARRFRDDLEREDSPHELIERMSKINHESPIAKWNTVVGSLDADYWNIGETNKGDNPYKI